MTQSRGIGRGGRRPGSGRKPGARNKATLLKTEILPRLAAHDQQLPLYRLLDRIADENLDPRYRDVLAISVLPFMHAKVSASMVVKPAYLMTDAELSEVARAEQEHQRQTALGRGRLHMVKKGEE